MIYVGDMRNLRGNPHFRASARLVIADPPYNIGRNYGETFNDNQSEVAFRQFLQEMVDSIHWCCTDDASIVVFMSEKHQADLAIALRNQGFITRRVILWYNSFAVHQTNNFAESCRFLYYCVRQRKRFTFNKDVFRVPSLRQTQYHDSRANPNGRIMDNLFNDSRICGTFKEKSAYAAPDNQLPLALVQRLVAGLSTPCDPVLDPFLGSGTTGAACEATGRADFTGVELNEKFAWGASQRLGAGNIPQSLPSR